MGKKVVVLERGKEISNDFLKKGGGQNRSAKCLFSLFCDFLLRKAYLDIRWLLSLHSFQAGSMLS